MNELDKLIPVDREEIEKYVGKSQSYYGDDFVKYNGYYLISYVEVEPDERCYELFEVYLGNKPILNTKVKTYKDFIEFVDNADNTEDVDCPISLTD